MIRRFLIAATFTLTALVAHADPAWKRDLTPARTGPHPPLAPTDLDFQLSWKGMINSGKLRIEFAPADAKKPGQYVVRSSAESLGAAAVLFPYRSSFWSELDPASFAPLYFHAKEMDNKEDVTTTVRYFASRVDCQEIEKTLKTGLTKTNDKVFHFAPVFDIFSAMLHVRSQKLADGDTVTMVVCPFKNPYLLRVSVAGHEIHNGRNAIRLTLGMQKIDRDTMELQAYKKLKRDATLWLSDDTDRIPIEFRALAFIGDVRAVLAVHRKR